MSDAKTLRLAQTPITAKTLEAFLTYQRALLEHLKTADGEWAGRFAFAHSQALKISGLTALTHGQLRSAIDEFCGKRWAAAVLRERIEVAREAGEQGASEKEKRVLENGPKELARVEDFTEFAARHGEPALELLIRSEEELLAMHQALARAQGSGHVHGN